MDDSQPMKRSFLWTVLLLLVLGIYLSLMFGHRWWSYAGVPELEPEFADMYIILAASDGYRMGIDVFRDNLLDPFGRQYVYSRIWLWIGYTGLSLKDNDLLGLLLAFTFIFSAVMLLKVGNFLEFVLSALLLLSPAVMLGIERGNCDLILFAILGCAGNLSSQKSLSRQAASASLLYLATFLKYYPVVSFAVFVYAIKTRGKFWALAAFSAIIVGAYALWSLQDLQLLNKTIPRPDAREGFTFGGALIFNALGMSLPHARTVALCLGGVLTGIFFSKAPFSLKLPLKQTSPRCVSLFLVGTSVLLFCFFLNTNYYYRCVFFLLLLPLFFELLQIQGGSPKAKRVAWAILLLVGIVSYHGVFRTIAYLTCFFFESPLPIALFKDYFVFFEQTCAWLLMLSLLSIEAEFLRQPLHFLLKCGAKE